ncbi:MULTISPECIES: acyl carrier protein [unclassified Streptomyces]|uniref:acyl carrier protein n=1 Tax=unclassified Streptomyces TaxID=2593676 RepID=UPI0036E0D7F2
MSSAPITTYAVRDWLTELIASYVELPAEEIDPDTGIVEYGIDSMYKMEMALAIEEQYGVTVDPSSLRDAPTINGIAVNVTALASGETKNQLIQP